MITSAGYVIALVKTICAIHCIARCCLWTEALESCLLLVFPVGNVRDVTSSQINGSGVHAVLHSFVRFNHALTYVTKHVTMCSVLTD